MVVGEASVVEEDAAGNDAACGGDSFFQKRSEEGEKKMWDSRWDCERKDEANHRFLKHYSR